MKSPKSFSRSVLVGIFLIGCLAAFAQERIRSPLGFSIDNPKGWIVTSDEKMADSLKNLDMSEDAIDKLIESRNGSIQLAAFQKYPTDAKDGPIPTIQVRVRPNPIPAFSDFMGAFLRSVDPSRMPLPEYRIVSSGKDVISGYPAVRVESTYSLNSEQLRARTYAIPVGKQYYQVTFIDLPSNDDCSKVFDSTVQSIKISRTSGKRQ